MSEFTGSFSFSGGVNLRLAKSQDQNFLFDLFVEARPWLSWAEGNRDFIRSLFEQQFQVMQRGLESTYPDYFDFVIERVGVSVGRVIIHLGYADWRISELQILKQARRSGIGTSVIRGVQAAAERARLPLTLSTPIFGSDGFSIYHRLGFQIVQAQPPMIHMAWFPSNVVRMDA